jgi:alkylhydroperoxidase/carboxymuconolactone decarboxylase family protein YurZ
MDSIPQTARDLIRRNWMIPDSIPQKTRDLIRCNWMIPDSIPQKTRDLIRHQTAVADSTCGCYPDDLSAALFGGSRDVS